MKVKNVYEPENEDITEWIDSNSDFWPASDLDYYVMNGNNDHLVFKLANDISCPKKDFFVHCLYYIVGDFVSSGGKSDHMRSRIAVLLNLVDDNSAPEVILWRQRSQRLLAGDEPFRRNFWDSFMFHKGTM